jgi:membrane protease YdiL (CAAX protease family)
VLPPPEPRQSEYRESPYPLSGNGHRPADPVIPGALEEAVLDPRTIPEGPPPSPPSGPPGSTVFSIEGRPAPGLYVGAWALSLVGIVILFGAVQTGVPIVRFVLFVLGLLVVGAGMSLGAGYQVVARSRRPASAYRGPSPVLLFVIALVLSTTVGVVLFGGGDVDTQQPVGFLAAILVVQASYLVPIVLFVRRTGVLTWHDMGWPRMTRTSVVRFLNDAGFAIALTLPVTVLVLILAGIVGSALDVQAPEVVPTAATSIDAITLLLAAALLAPIGEEIFFRGFALTAWHRDLGPRSALVRSSVFFALVHVANVQATSFSQGVRQAILEVVVILPLGLLLGWMFQRRGIFASIAGHCAYNGTLLALTFLAARFRPPG